MSKRVPSLKRATPRMKYQHMIFMMDWKSDLKDRQSEYAEKKHRFQVTWFWNLRRLKRIDPDWESWYDRRPEQTCGEMLPLILERIEEIVQTTGRKP